jgi:hypothetical protein
MMGRGLCLRLGGDGIEDAETCGSLGDDTRRARRGRINAGGWAAPVRLKEPMETSRPPVSQVGQDEANHSAEQ